MSGRLIVFEGADGAGKATQTHLMARRLQAEGAAFREIDFPLCGACAALSGGCAGEAAGGRERLCRLCSVRGGPLRLL